MHPIDDAFAPLLGLPTWQVERGVGTFLTLDLGDPEIVLDEPRRRPILVGGTEHQVTTRNAGVRGAWHLWIYCCEWRISTDGIVLAHSGSADGAIAGALSIVQGQALLQVEVAPDTPRTTFFFDLGAVLETQPAPPGTYGDEPVEQWTLFQPSGSVLAVREDGRFAATAAGVATDRWEPLPAER